MAMSEHRADGFVISVNFRNTELSAWQSGEIVWQHEFGNGAVDWLFAIMSYIRFEKHLLVGRATAEHIILEIGSARPLDEEHIKVVRGRDLDSGLPLAREITSIEIRDVITNSIAGLVAVLSPMFRNSDYPSNLAAAVKKALLENPIVLTGEFGQLKKLNEYFQEILGLSVIVEKQDRV